MRFLVTVKKATALTAELSGVPYPFPPDPPRPALRDLLTYLVREELAAYRRREADRKLLHVLAEPEIARLAAAGKVAMGARDADPPPIDEARAVTLAHDSFTQGLYLVFADGVQLSALDTPVPIHDGLRILLVQLTLLIGR